MTTAAAAQSMPTARERAMALDLLDAEPITYLTEDENPWFSDPVESRFSTPFFVDGEEMWSDFEQAEREYYYMAGRSSL